MILSGSLLTLFICRWLQSEYTSEKMDLQKDLFGQFVAAKSKVTDSLIAKNLINPILNNPGGFKIATINKMHDGDSVQLITTDITLDTMLPRKISFDSIPAGNESFKVRIEQDSDLLYNGVKMFIKKVHGPKGEEDFFERYIEPGDTIMLKSFFSQALDSSNIHVSTIWTSNNNRNQFPPPPFYYESHFFEHPFGVQITNYNNYLLRKILPQGVFALLLLLITITAFIFSYRSIRTQMRLAVLKDDLISNISHELKTPVATVKVAIEAMQQMDPVEKKETIKNYLGMASQEINRLDLLVNKVMNSILLDNGRQVFRSEKIALAPLIREIIDTMQIQMQQHNAFISFSCDDEDITVAGDALHMKGVLYNLIENCLKYGNSTPAIDLHLRHSPMDILLECSDNGPGIPEQYISKVFEKFFRVPSGDQHTIKGYGLGLYYCAQVIKEMGGSIAVKNNAGAGCTFTIRLDAGK